MARQALADITPATEDGAIDTSSDITSASELGSKGLPRFWDSLCVSEDCPIKHPHKFGLRRQTNIAPLIIWQDPDAVIADGHDYPDTQPPPLIKAMIDTLRTDPMIKTNYPKFTDVLRDFYRAHGGRSDKYHGPEGMFGLGTFLSDMHGDGFYPYHKHPDEEQIGGWFAFEIKGDEKNEAPMATGGC